MLCRFVFMIMLALALSPLTARASDYVDPTWDNLTKSLVRFNAINLSELPIIDEYAIITECDLFKAFYYDDFKWNQVRQAVRDSVKNNVGSFPMHYHYDVKLQLDHYDFESKVYRFTGKSALLNVNTFVLFQVLGTGCGIGNIKFLPRVFRAVLASPLYLEGLPLNEADAKALFEQMKESDNSDHLIFARFNLSILYIDPLRKSTSRFGAVTVNHYAQSNAPQPETVRFDVRLDSIDFYADNTLAHLVYQYEP
jgi:hypothetical protein